MRPLLVMDGDSFAHRAYHALPKSMRRADGGPENAVVGFTNMLLRLWQAERPRAVVVGWDTLEVPTYRHRELAGYQAGRVFDAALLEQLDRLPGLVAATGIVNGKAPGYEADDFLAAAVAAEQAAGGTSLVATSDRDSFQLAAPDVDWNRLAGLAGTIVAILDGARAFPQAGLWRVGAKFEGLGDLAVLTIFLIVGAGIGVSFAFN